MGVYWGLTQAVMPHPLGYADLTCQDGLVTDTSPSDDEWQNSDDRRGGQVTMVLTRLSASMLTQETFLVGQESLREDRTQDCLQVLAFDLYFLHNIKKACRAHSSIGIICWYKQWMVDKDLDLVWIYLGATSPLTASLLPLHLSSVLMIFKLSVSNPQQGTQLTLAIANINSWNKNFNIFIPISASSKFQNTCYSPHNWFHVS